MLRFGTGGIPLSTPKPADTVTGISHSRAMGLDAMELAMVRSINISPQKAPQVRQTAEREDVLLTVHAPYWISFTTDDAEKLEKSRRWLLDASRVGALCGARSVTFHAGGYADGEPEEAYRRVKRELEGILSTLRDEGVQIRVRPETTGKGAQFGSLEEVLSLSRDLPLAPCLDFAHLHARSAGGLSGYEDAAGALEQVARELGEEALRDMHIHLSGIKYSEKGERGHLPLEESDLPFREVLQALRDFQVQGVVICESPEKDSDALLLRDGYRALEEG